MCSLYGAILAMTAHMSPRILCMMVVAASFACGGAQQSPQLAKLPDPGPSGVYKPEAKWPGFGNGEERIITIQLGPDGSKMCRTVSPKFPYDSAIVQVEERPQLDAIASCLNHASMVDRSILLVGRADPRGTAEYNDQLGTKRALKIKEMLIQDGVAESRITVESIGSAEAMGNRPDYSFGYDRRVDIMVSGAHAPRGAQNAAGTITK